MTVTKEVFIQQAQNDQEAWQNICEVAGILEDHRINTYIVSSDTNIRVCVLIRDYKKALDLVYSYWHKGQ